MQNSTDVSKWFFQKHAVVIIMLGLCGIIVLLLFSDLSASPTIVSEKVDPYVLSTKGNTLIIRDTSTTVPEQKQSPIFIGDTIKTSDSTATVFWPDGSITRLGEKTSIKIHEMRAKTANEDIQIDFSLHEGKSWSNVIKYYFGNSYFHERFNNDTALAAVRGTVFEVNLDRKYIHTIDHAVSIENIQGNTGSVFVVAGGVFDTDTRRTIIREKIDKVWNETNANADIVYLNERMEILNKAILSQLGSSNYLQIFLQKMGLQKDPTYLRALIQGDQEAWGVFEQEMKQWTDTKELMDIYQEFYGLKNTEKLIETKMKLRDILVATAGEEDKQTLLTDFARSTLYDSWDALEIWTGSIEWLQKKLRDYIQQGADKELIETLRNASEDKNVHKWNDAMEQAKDTLIETLSEKNLLEEAKKNIDTEELKKINDQATEIRENLMDSIKSLMR